MATFGEAPKGNAKSGEKIFKTKCAQCHAVEKAGGHKQGMSIVFHSRHHAVFILADRVAATSTKYFYCRSAFVHQVAGS